MPDWTKSMQQTFEYYIVDPTSWKDSEKLDNILSSTITRDSEVDTLGSATIDITNMISECYIRIYLVTIQNGIRERFPLGTYLVQSPSSSYNGKIKKVTMDAYTPLLELKENPPPVGYTIFRNENIMNMAYMLTRENTRAPVVKGSSSMKLNYDFTANTDDTWFSYIKDLAANANHCLDLDEMSRILFSPKQDTESLQPVWTYNDDNSSILYQDVDMDHDLYGIPNAVEVIYSNGSTYFHEKVINNDPNSPTSTVNRGREILYRETDPKLVGTPSNEQVKVYTTNLLKEMSTIEYSVTYSHGYCPVRLGDCIRLNYSRAGLNNIKAKVVSQTITCKSGCKVKEKAVFTKKLWR